MHDKFSSSKAGSPAQLAELIFNSHPSGCHLITDTNAHDLEAKVIVAGSAGATIATLTGTDIKLNGADVATLSSLTLAAGEALYGRFTAIDLSAGSVMIYS